jgi:hypothetical protein
MLGCAFAGTADEPAAIPPSGPATSSFNGFHPKGEF